MSKSRYFFDWDGNPEVVEDLKRRWELGQSATVIASALGPDFTRNSVIGRVHRMGLKAPEKKARKQTYNPKPPRPPKMTVEIPPDCPVPTVPPETFVVNGCKFISGDPQMPNWQMCGNQVVWNKSWCEHHNRICFDQTATQNMKKRNHG